MNRRAFLFSVLAVPMAPMVPSLHPRVVEGLELPRVPLMLTPGEHILLCRDVDALALGIRDAQRAMQNTLVRLPEMLKQSKGDR